MISNTHTLNSKPLISIIMNCFNGDKYLSYSLESIQRQTYQNWELIFWDNFSTDNSKQIFKSFNDKRFHYYHANEHTTLSKARNLALDKCKGDFIAFLDVDDWWSLNKLEQQIELFADPSIQLVYGNFLVNNFNWTSKSISFDNGLNTKILGNLKNINYEAKNIDIYKNDFTSEIYGALGISSELKLQKLNNNSKHLLTPKALLRFAPGSMRKEKDGSRLDSTSAFSINRLNSSK